MSLRCGLRAVNALLEASRRPPLTAEDLDAITARLHTREREVCPDGRDTVPDPEGNGQGACTCLIPRGGADPGAAVRGAAGVVREATASAAASGEGGRRSPLGAHGGVPRWHRGALRGCGPRRR